MGQRGGAELDNYTRPQPAIDEPPIEPPKRPAGGKGTNLYRSPARVGILSFIGFLTYPIWWLWQLFKFTRREGFPRAKSFWWILVPLYGIVVVWEQLGDLKHASADKNIRVRAGLILSFLVGGYLAIRLAGWKDASPMLVLAVLVLSALLTTIGIYLGQRSVVAYLAATYPTERRRGVSWGEIVATLMTLLFFVALSVFAYRESVPDAGPALTYVPPAMPVTGVTLSPGWTQYRDQASGFAIELPPDWASVAYDTVARGESPTRQLKFYAEANNMSANLAVRRWVTGQVSLDDYVAKHQAGLERAGATYVSHTRVALTVGEAELYRFSRTFADSVTLQFYEYVLVRDRGLRTTVYRIQFGAEDLTPATEDMFRSIVTTFQFL